MGLHIEERGRRDLRGRVDRVGADVIRQALRAGYVEELSISIAPVVLGGGKRLFDGSEGTVRLEHLALLQSPFATHLSYRVLR
jgi:riboflavin biosynthesis pyrimidine reductase